MPKDNYGDDGGRRRTLNELLNSTSSSSDDFKGEEGAMLAQSALKGSPKETGPLEQGDNDVEIGSLLAQEYDDGTTSWNTSKTEALVKNIFTQGPGLPPIKNLFGKSPFPLSLHLLNPI